MGSAILKEADALLTSLDAQWFEELDELDTAIPQRLLEKTVREAIAWHIQRLRDMREDLFAEYERAARRGVPYHERLSFINQVKLKQIEMEGKRMLQLQKSRYRVRPLRDWLQRGDYGLIKSWGLNHFVQVFLEEAIVYE